jgi:hypothetical protein
MGRLPRGGAGIPVLVLLMGLLGPFWCEAQEDTYEDASARALHEAALAAHERRDDSVVRYTALVRQRIGAALRMPLKDRTLFRSEAAYRVFWSRAGQTLVQVLALREETPLGVSRGQTHQGLFDQAFDPANDRLLFGFVDPDEDMGRPGDDDFWFEHPLLPEYRSSYRFSVGDTLAIALPDGRRVVAVELRVVPREADVHRMTGSLWIVPESGALVRAVYRLSDTFDAFRDIADLRAEEEGDLKHVPGLFKPWTFELSLIAVDYALWDFDVWLPRSMRAEGVATAGILKAPAAVDLSYEIEDVVTDADLAGERDDPDPVPDVRFQTRAEAMQYLERIAGDQDVPYVVERGWTERRGGRGRRTVSYLVPEDPDFLASSPELPPPVWEDGPGFTSQDEIEALFGGLADLPAPPLPGMPATFRWGLQRPDLVRYNRVEALSVGARGQLRPNSPVGPLSVTLTARLGAADRVPNVRLDVTREGLRRRVTWSAFHELAAVQEERRALGIGNSITAAIFGRDDGDYFRRSGAWLELSPPSAERTWFRVRALAEYHRPVGAETGFAVWHLADDAWAFRPNLEAAEGWEVGGLVTLSPYWGGDPRAVQGGVELSARASGADFEYASASLEARVAIPLPSDLRMGLEAGAGTSWGAPPPQRLWLMGGAATLRGYGPRALEGRSYWRARGELARQHSFGALSLFGDLAWAGPRDRIRLDDALAAAGVGLSLVDGLIRLDAAWALRAPRGFRLEAYLDGIL